MIKFPCMCQFELEVPDELAGGLIQCPRCSRLCDVPTLGELSHLRPDGTIELDEPEPLREPDRLKQLSRAFRPSKVDDSGVEIDLRMSPEALEEVGAPEEPVPVTPKYDPITGELVRPLEIKQDPDLPDGPIPVAKAALTYSTERVLHRITGGRILLELFMPVNMFVMFWVYLGHVAPTVGAMVAPPHPIAAFLVLLVFVFPATLLVMAHYGNVIEDMGPDGYDELHRPLRDASIWDDILAPFGRMILALGICFGPAVLALVFKHVPDDLRWTLAWPLAGIGIILLPAVLLTTMTSGTFVNLRPDRLLGVIRACGAEYVFAMLAGLVAVGLYVWNSFGLYLLPDSAFARMPWLAYLGHEVVSFTLLTAAVYFGHFFCWYLGLLYRRHHGAFSWAMQHHVPTRREMRRQPQMHAAGATPARRAPTPRPAGRETGGGDATIPLS